MKGRKETAKEAEVFKDQKVQGEKRKESIQVEKTGQSDEEAWQEAKA